jgi:hypothetical protein
MAIRFGEAAKRNEKLRDVQCRYEFSLGPTNFMDGTSGPLSHLKGCWGVSHQEQDRRFIEISGG